MGPYLNGFAAGICYAEVYITYYADADYAYLHNRSVHSADTANEKAPLRRGLFRVRPRGFEPPPRKCRTRPSTWRVYQFRHRRERDGEYRGGRFLSNGLDAVRRLPYCSEH